MRTMNQPLATSFRCARRTLHWLIELIRVSPGSRRSISEDDYSLPGADGGDGQLLTCPPLSQRGTLAGAGDQDQYLATVTQTVPTHADAIRGWLGCVVNCVDWFVLQVLLTGEQAGSMAILSHAE